MKSATTWMGATAAAAALAGAAAAQDERSEAEIFGDVLGALFGAQPQQEQEAQPAAPQVERMWRYTLSRYDGPALCRVTLHERARPAGDGRYATPEAGCPYAWLDVRRYRVDDRTGDLVIGVGDSGEFWRGRRVGDSRYQGRTRDGEGYQLTFAERVERAPAGGTPGYAGGEEAIYGAWRMSEVDGFSSCNLELPPPDPDDPFQRRNAVQAPAGCPGSVFMASEWVLAGGELRFLDNFDQAKATLRQTGPGFWEGATDGGTPIEMRRR